MADQILTATPPPVAHQPSAPRAAGELFLISALILFLELACIRWFPAHVLFLTFFTNTILLACFLGMSLGCLAAGHQRNYIATTPLLLGIALLAGRGVELLRDQMDRIVDVGNQASPQLVYFGTEYHSSGDVARFVVPIEVVGGFFFVAVVLALIGPGQELGRALTRLPNRVQAYTVNILGSVAGISLFALCSWLQLSPTAWFLLIAVGLGCFLFHRPFTRRQATRGVLLVLVVLAAGTRLASAVPPTEQFWSPYYRIDYSPDTKLIGVNLIGHQQMISRQTTHPAYAVPYLLNRDSGARPFEDVLIIGAGSGNDVSRAVQWHAKHIDAVEIDPRIAALGKAYHPDQPYSEANVTVYQGDGRNFLRSTDRKYDLIIYALVDSLVLHSSYSNIRLESYLFTKEAFAEVERRLKPDGLFVMYNYFRQGWIVARLKTSLQETFQAEPLVLTMPYRDAVDPEESWSGFTIFIAGRQQALEPLRKAFQSPDPAMPVVYWMDSNHAPGPESPNGFEVRPEPNERANWEPFGLAQVGVPPDIGVATDDWPFLYLRRPMIPDLSVRGAAIMGGLALLLLLWFVPPRPAGELPSWRQEARGVGRYWTERRSGGDRFRSFDGRMFFLGAGFMLIETKAVVHMALLFGSTWMVNSVVFFAVLVMILFANLFVLSSRPRHLGLYYAGLFVTLVLNAVIPLNSFLGWGPSLQIGGSCLLVFAPILFAAVIFAVSFSRTQQADRAFGFNIAGAMLGGLAEYSSMLLGFRYLELVALGFYLLSALWLSGAPAKAPVKELDPQPA
jgi:SAM-dependent methyltransferase